MAGRERLRGERERKNEVVRKRKRAVAVPMLRGENERGRGVAAFVAVIVMFYFYCVCFNQRFRTPLKFIFITCLRILTCPNLLKYNRWYYHVIISRSSLFFLPSSNSRTVRDVCVWCV